MTREEAKSRAELYSALTEGKTIQVLSCKGEWIDIKTDKLDYLKNYYKYRIKLEPKYRPFKSREECWNEMLKHQPFGWLREKANKKEMVHIGRIYDISDDVLITLSINEGRNDSSNYFFRAYTFIDGAPFGIKEE